MTQIDPGSWQVTILPLPKGFARGIAHGFCGGHAVGHAEIPRGNKVIGCWWPDGKAEPLTLKGHAVVKTGRAHGNVIPGHWSEPKSGMMGAVAWSLRGGKLVGTELHDSSYEKTWAVAAGQGGVVGMGVLPQKPGQRRQDVGLLWQHGARALTQVTAPGVVSLLATDGIRLAGSITGRAALWPSAQAPPIDLTPANLSTSEVQGLDGELQVGVAWKGWSPRAALWRGSAASFIDLSPKGSEAASAYDSAQGFQVGFVRTKDNTSGGTPGSDNRATLWQGSADDWFDLNALLPAKTYNASIAWAIEFHHDMVVVCGAAQRYEAIHPGTAHESHAIPVQHPVVWTARVAS